MNREQRRAYNRKNKTNYTKQEFDMMVAVERIKRGYADFSDLELPKDFVHIDNKDLCPDGTEVRLHFESLESRCKTMDASNKLFCDWVANAKKEPEKIYHITRENAKNSLVCLAEDVRYVELDGKKVQAPPWLFDLYSDLEIYHNGQWVQVGLADTNTLNQYSEIKAKIIKK